MNDDFISEDKFNLKLTPDEQRACDYLDELHTYDNFFEFSKPSDLLKGALWLIRNPDKSNPDSVHQAAHSIREIFYSLGNNDRIRKNRLKKYSDLTLEEQKSLQISSLLHQFYTVITAIAHHFANSKSRNHWISEIRGLGISAPNDIVDAVVLEGLISYFVQLLRKSSLDIVEIHKKIDDVILTDSSHDTKESLEFLFNLHFDAKSYFFSKVDLDWFDWLLDKGFFDSVKQLPNENSDTRYYHSPEMEYLIRISKTNPDKFTDFFQTFAITEENFDIGILNQVIWAIEELPASELKKMALKIRNEEWVKLLGNTHNSGYQYEVMLNTLVKDKEWESVLHLAEAILILQPKKNNETEPYLLRGQLFYVDDLGYTKVFSHLINIPPQWQESALELVSKVVGDIEKRTVKEKGEIFPDGDNHSYMDTDFFTASVIEEPGRSSRKNTKNIAATFRLLLEKTIGGNCGNPEKVRELFKKFIEPLPMSRSMWRLRLYVFSLCPEIFKDELKKAFFRLFEVGDNYNEIDSGTEYQKTLRHGFRVLSNSDQRGFIDKTFSYFTEQADKHQEEKWHLNSGWETLSSISDYLTLEDKKLCKEKFGRDPASDYDPQPVMSRSTGGLVHDRSPVNLSDFNVEEIVRNLKEEWKPSILEEKYKQDDFLAPRNAQGLGNAIKADLKERPDEYLTLAESFFDRKNIHPHYTYSFLRGIEEMSRENKLPKVFDWKNLFGLFTKILARGESENFDDVVEDGRWLSGWIPVHDVIADILIQLQTDTYNDVFPFKEFRDDILEIIKYCTTINSPKPEKETSEYSDLRSIAFSSVRGKAFLALTHFVQYDGMQFEKDQAKHLNDDVKELYLNWLKNESSKAVRFMFGYYLHPYYFSDKSWFKNEGILRALFDSGNDSLNIASWEGYLNQSVHEELFNLLEEKYLSSLTLKDEEGTKHGREYSFDELIGTHIALVYTHFECVTLDSDLFKELWIKADAGKQKKFISSIGSHVAHRDDKWREDNKVDVNKLKTLWEWVLENVDDPEVFSGFGSWVSHERDSFEISWLVEQVRKTIIKSQGNIEWDYGISQSLGKFAQINPAATLDILEHYLLQGEDLNPHRESWFTIDKELIQTLKIIYQNQVLKEKVYDFVNRLIQAGGQKFWPLRNILD